MKGLAIVLLIIGVICATSAQEAVKRSPAVDEYIEYHS